MQTVVLDDGYQLHTLVEHIETAVELRTTVRLRQSNGTDFLFRPRDYTQIALVGL